MIKHLLDLRSFIFALPVHVYCTANSYVMRCSSRSRTLMLRFPGFSNDFILRTYEPYKNTWNGIIRIHIIRLKMNNYHLISKRAVRQLLVQRCNVSGVIQRQCWQTDRTPCKNVLAAQWLWLFYCLQGLGDLLHLLFRLLHMLFWLLLDDLQLPVDMFAKVLQLPSNVGVRCAHHY